MPTNGAYVSPVYRVQAVPLHKVRANLYNPNFVAPDEMRLLETSMREDGVTQPVVVYFDEATGMYEIVDGYHRYRTIRDTQEIRERENGTLPVVVLEGKDTAERMASTIRHNRARGSHDWELMAQIVGEVADSGMRDAWISKHFGMSRDEILRLRQIIGIQKVKGLYRAPDDSPAPESTTPAAEAVQETLPVPDGRSPVYRVQAVPISMVRGNAYNPNVVKPREMRLLETSMWLDGITQPVVVYFDEATGMYEIVDGYHRYCTVRDVKKIRERENGTLPVVVLQETDMPHRMASTVRHNRARGSHNINLMSDIVKSAAAGYSAATGTSFENKSDSWMLTNFGMDAEELLLMKDTTPLANRFIERTFPQERREATRQRLEILFRDFDNIVVAFSGGKDSGAMLHLVLDYMREHNIQRRITVLHFDYEGQYTATTEYVTKIMNSYPDLEPVWVCLPFDVTCEVSMHQRYWTPWNPEQKDIWARDLPDHPGVIHTGNVPADFPAYKGVWDYHVQEKTAAWLHHRAGADRTAVLVGIRTQESLHRHAALHREDRTAASMWDAHHWTNRTAKNVYNAYPIYDWDTEDIWTANGTHNWPYNELYDLFHMCGVSLSDMRVASPFRGEGQESLKLYRVIDPEMWAKLVGRVNGVNFAALYAGTGAMGNPRDVKLPEGHTWKSYANFLLSTIEDDEIREGYLRKLRSSIKYWTVKGGALPVENADELREQAPAGTEFLGKPTDNRKRSRPYEVVKFPQYPDDLPHVSDESLVPTYKRLVITILRCDHACKYMGFGQTKREITKRSEAVEKWSKLL